MNPRLWSVSHSKKRRQNSSRAKKLQANGVDSCVALRELLVPTGPAKDNAFFASKGADAHARFFPCVPLSSRCSFHSLS